MVTRLEPRRADDERRFGGDTGIERRFERARRGEIDEHVRGGRQLGDIAALVDAAAALPRLGDGGGKCDAHPPFAADTAAAGHMPSPDYGLPVVARVDRRLDPVNATSQERRGGKECALRSLLAAIQTSSVASSAPGEEKSTSTSAAAASLATLPPLSMPQLRSPASEMAAESATPIRPSLPIMPMLVICRPLTMASP